MSLEVYKKPYVIGICGGSCSGKSYVTDQIANVASHTFNPEASLLESDLENITKLHQDAYYKGGNSETNFDEPVAIDWALFELHISELIKGNPIDCPIYSFEKHTRLEKTKKVYPAKVIIIEGTMIFTSKQILSYCYLKVFVSAFREMMYERRLERDVKERGRDENEIKRRYFEHVRPGLVQYIEPTQQYADIILHNNNNNHEFVGLEILLDHIEEKLKQ